MYKIYKTMDSGESIISFKMVVLFSKFLPGHRDSQLLLDSENYSYSRRKDKDTALNTDLKWSKNRSLKCNAMVFLTPSNSQP